MGGYILKRLLSAIPVLLGITVIVFLIMAMIPGDPATAILGSYATPENVEKLNRDLGLDKPLVQRYFIWLGNMLQGDFGRSFALNRPVLDEVLERFNATLILAGTAFVLCSVLGIAAGVDLGGQPVRAGGQGDHLRGAAGHLDPVLLPRHDDDPHLRGEPALVPGLGHVADLRGPTIWVLLDHLAMPAIALAVVATGVIARLSRSAMLEVLRQDFIRTARAKGVPSAA
jgi:peptide/nickel transport system permease protein